MPRRRRPPPQPRGDDLYLLSSPDPPLSTPGRSLSGSMSYTRMERIARPAGATGYPSRVERFFGRGESRTMATMAGGGEHGRDARIRTRGRDEVFPGLEGCIWVGVLVGLSLSLLGAGLLGYSDWELLSLVGTGVGL